MNPNNHESKQDFLNRCTLEKQKGGDSAQAAFLACNMAWDTAKNQRSPMALGVPVLMSAGGDDKKEGNGFLINAYSGAPIERFWGTLVIDVTGIEAKEKIPVLREHIRDRVVGYGATFKDDSSFNVQGEFSGATRDAQEVKDLADEGYPWQASVQVRAKKIKVLETKDAKEIVNGREIVGPAEIWTESNVGEVSFVSLGADDNTAAIRFAELSDQKHPVEIESWTDAETKLRETENDQPISEEETTMDLDTLKEQHPELLKSIQDAAREEGETLGRQEERDRVNDILSANGDADATQTAIKDGLSSADAYKLFFEAERKKRVDTLSNMENDAPESLGTDDGGDEESFEGTVDQVLAQKAAKLAMEKGIDMAAAQAMVLKDDPELRDKYAASFQA